jgi:hypothetical protein
MNQGHREEFDMCGRFTLRSRPAEVAQLFGVEAVPSEPR